MQDNDSPKILLKRDQNDVFAVFAVIEWNKSPENVCETFKPFSVGYALKAHPVLRDFIS